MINKINRDILFILLPLTVSRTPGSVGVGDRDDPLAKGLVRVEEDGVILPGAPLGSPTFVAKAVKEKVEKVRAITELLPELQDPHTEFVLLCSCLSLFVDGLDLDVEVLNAPLDPRMKYFQVFAESIGFFLRVHITLM